jgi:hypothetical protein
MTGRFKAGYFEPLPAMEKDDWATSRSPRSWFYNHGTRILPREPRAADEISAPANALVSALGDQEQRARSPVPELQTHRNGKMNNVVVRS